MRIQGLTMFRAITKCGRFLVERLLLFVSSGCVLSTVSGYSIVIAGNISPLEVGLRQTMVVLEDGENSSASSAVVTVKP